MTPISSQGTVVMVTISGTPTAIPGVKKCPLPNSKQVFDDTTALDSAGSFPTRIPVGFDFPTTQLEIVFDPANVVHQYLVSASNAASVEAFSIQLPGAANFKAAFSAYVSSAISPEVRKAVLSSFTLEINGAITYTHA